MPRKKMPKRKIPRRRRNASTEYGGFVLTFEPGRTQGLQDRLHPEVDFSDSFSTLDWDLQSREIVAIVLQQEPLQIHAFSMMERMHGSGGSGKRKMRMAKPLLVFDNPIAFEDLESPDLESLVSTPERLIRLDWQTWNDFTRHLQMLRPADASRINEILALRTSQHRLPENGQRELRLNEQRDGLGLALDIGGLDRAEVLKSMNIERAANAMSVLDLLDDLPIHERSLLEHDQKILSLVWEEQPVKSAIFGDDSGRSVRVIVTDQTDLETVLGIDLLIYNCLHDNYILLQYKRMQKEPKGWSYPIPPSSDLLSQLQKAKNFKAAVARQRDLPPPSLWSYRLSADPFFFKFCEQFRPNSRDESLIPGITMSSDHLDEFLQLPEAANSRGGTAVGYHNCPRYLNNSEFIQLAKSGWIGTSSQSASLLKDILAANKTGGRQAMLAIIDPPEEKTAAGRRRK